MTDWIKPQQDTYLPYQSAYIALVPEGDLMEQLRRQKQHTLQLFSGLTAEQLAYRYAEDKWRVQEILQHLIDCERILCYRALRFARKDSTPLPGFEEDWYVTHSAAMERSINEMLEEYAVVRDASIALFRSFTPAMRALTGTANNGQFTVNAIAFVVAGHELHHLRILKERYQIG